ncbi:MAG: hypothetical protein ACK5Q5_03495 [Planctomycetaceae bacterium]
MSTRRLTTLLLISLGGLGTASAQDFRVYTAVSEVAPDNVSRKVVARSLTLFHAGKVYDHMEEVGELVIFEPVQDRFLLIRDRLATEVSLDELRTMLDAAETAADRYTRSLQQRTDREAVKVRTQLEFQLHPQFETQFNAAEKRLSLIGTEFSYLVRGSDLPGPEWLPAYTQYADWTARLNTVLHSQGTFPGSREALNRALVEHQVLPISVALQARDPRDLNLQAEHEFRWQLQPIDRDLIHRWEQLRQSNELRWVSFREYQHKLLAASERSAR